MESSEENHHVMHLGFSSIASTTTRRAPLLRLLSSPGKHRLGRGRENGKGHRNRAGGFCKYSRPTLVNGQVTYPFGHVAAPHRRGSHSWTGLDFHTTPLID